MQSGCAIDVTQLEEPSAVSIVPSPHSVGTQLLYFTFPYVAVREVQRWLKRQSSCNQYTKPVLLSVFIFQSKLTVFGGKVPCQWESESFSC